MYDMYPWNEPDSGANHEQDHTAAARLPAPRNGARHANATAAHADFTTAIQFALDRRDNGGDAVPASAPATPPAAPPATPPAASLTRQS